MALLPVGRIATVSIQSQITNDFTLIDVDATIESPSPLTFQALGGLVKYIIVIDPLANFTDCMPGDILYITSFPPHAIDPTRQYMVLQADPEGGGSIGVCRLAVGTRTLNG